MGRVRSCHNVWTAMCASGSRDHSTHPDGLHGLHLRVDVAKGSKPCSNWKNKLSQQSSITCTCTKHCDCMTHVCWHIHAHTSSVQVHAPGCIYVHSLGGSNEPSIGAKPIMYRLDGGPYRGGAITEQ